jgi:small subunit ribosomal protein S6
VSREYEAVYIFESTLDDTAVNEKLDRFHGLLGLSGDQIDINHRGRRQLAYKIGTRENGYYAVARFSVEPDVLPEYERALKHDDGVVRSLVTLHEHDVGAPPISEEEMAAAAARGDDDDDEE